MARPVCVLASSAAAVDAWQPGGPSLYGHGTNEGRIVLTRPAFRLEKLLGGEAVSATMPSVQECHAADSDGTRSAG